jgi:hypothetical protein
VKKVTINLDKYECDIDLETVNRNCIFEEKMVNGIEK